MIELIFQHPWFSFFALLIVLEFIDSIVERLKG